MSERPGSNCCYSQRVQPLILYCKMFNYVRSGDPKPWQTHFRLFIESEINSSIVTLKISVSVVVKLRNALITQAQCMTFDE